MNYSADRSIRNITISFSVLLHVVLLVQFSSTLAGSRATAPHYDTRVSLNLLPVAKPEPPPEPVKPQPVKKSRPRPHPEKYQQPVVQEVAKAPQLAEKIQRDAETVIAPIRQRYLSELLTHIEGHKYYPQSARRRGLQGSIQVSFRLLEDGNIHGLDVKGGPVLLQHAAKGAVKQALPLPVPPPEVKCPIQVSYAMQYQLN